MDIYEKTALAAENYDYITVVQEFGRAIRRAVNFISMMGAPVDDDVYLQPDGQISPADARKLKQQIYGASADQIYQRAVHAFNQSLNDTFVDQ